MTTLRVSFDYEANPAHYGTEDPAKMAEIDLENIQCGSSDINDLFDEKALDNITITPVSG
jgi:hypothetical protein